MNTYNIIPVSYSHTSTTKEEREAMRQASNPTPRMITEEEWTRLFPNEPYPNFKKKGA